MLSYIPERHQRVCDVGVCAYIGVCVMLLCMMLVCVCDVGMCDIDVL